MTRLDAARTARAARLHGIYAILNAAPGDPLALARAALEGGARIVQYRAKDGIDDRALRALRRLTRDADALLILNDNFGLVAQYDCDGVHLGPDDDGFADVARVRAALPDRLIGLSCGTPAEARVAGDADYLGVGAVYPTASKADAGTPIGVAGLGAVIAATRLPVAAIAGISAVRLPEVRAAGAAMAAVIGAIASAADPVAATRQLVVAWERAAP